MGKTSRNNVAFEEGNKLQNLYNVLIVATSTVSLEVKLLLFNCKLLHECKQLLVMEGMKNFFWRRGLMGKGWSVFGGGSGFLEIEIINFTSQLLFNLLFMCRLKNAVSPVIFHSRF